MTLFKNLWAYILLILLALLVSWATANLQWVDQIFSTMPTGLYLVVALLCVVGYGLNALAPRTVVPSFVWAIFFGISLQPVLKLVTGDVKTLQIIVELLAAIVLFGGGVDLPFKSFKKHFGSILSLSLIGTVLTAFLFAISLEYISPMFGIIIPSAAFVLLGAILASTDPTAIIPCLGGLKFKKPFVKDIAISESAVNDVAGTLLTRFFLVSVIAAGGTGTVVSLFMPFFDRHNMSDLATEILFGLIVGLVGAYLLKLWAKKQEKEGNHAADPALFISAPILTFAIGSLIGGSGFLAAFVCGLIYDSNDNTKAVRHFFDTSVDKFVKPIIFILLGAVVPVAALIESAPIGIAAALIFMFILRPIVVYFTLFPWSLGKKALLTWRELMFLSFVRETGAIPAVLILVAVGMGVPSSEFIFAIGMWVILLTLIIQPPFTPMLAKRLGLIEG